MAHQEPEIWELLSEMEKRDQGSKDVQAPARDPRGFAVINTTGHEVGKVHDLYVDPHTRAPRFALLSLGSHALGIGNRSILVAYADLEAAADKQVRITAAL